MNGWKCRYDEMGVKPASPSLQEFATERVMDGHGIRSQERAAHFGQISYGREKVKG